MPRGEPAGAARAEAAAPSPPGRRLLPLARRYYPLGIAGAFLGTLVGFFPSVVPLGVSGSFLFAGGGWGAPRPHAGTAATGPPVASAFPPGLVAGSDTSALGATGTAGGYGADTSGAVPSAPAASSPGSPPGSQPPSGSCPVPLPATGSALAGVFAVVDSLCRTLVRSHSSQTVPSLFAVPGVAPTPQAAAAHLPPEAPAAWVALDVPASGAQAAASAPGPPTAPGEGRATVVLGLVQGAPVPGPFEPAARALRRDGAAVVALVVPDLRAPGGAGAFAGWVSRTVAALPDATLVAVGVGAPQEAAASSAVAADALAGLGAAEQAVAPASRAGLWWGDGGIGAGDASVWRALAPSAGSVPPVLRASAFVGATLGAPGTPATSPCALGAEVNVLRGQVSGTLGRDAPPVEAELAVGPFPSPGVPSAVATPGPAGGCAVPPSGAPGLAPVVWRLGAGPPAFDVEPGS